MRIGEDGNWHLRRRVLEAVRPFVDSNLRRSQSPGVRGGKGSKAAVKVSDFCQVLHDHGVIEVRGELEHVEFRILDPVALEHIVRTGGLIRRDQVD